jgi:heme/copper-type cytochrome/quinol oxidase subunit 1
MTEYGTSTGAIALGFAAWLSTRMTASFGWFSHAPLSDTSFTVAPSSTLVVSLALGTVGLLLVGAGVGVVIGRRLR